MYISYVENRSIPFSRRSTRVTLTHIVPTLIYVGITVFTYMSVKIECLESVGILAACLFTVIGFT